jgi:hypothetical protein
LDTPSDSISTALDTNSAASLFAEMLDPSAKTEQVDTDIELKKAKEAPEDAQANPDDAAEAEADDPVVTIKVDGKDIDVPLSELKKGYQKDASANQRFEQAAEMRKTAEAERAKAQTERATYANNLQRIQVQLESALQQQQQINWQALLESDPVEYLKQQRLATERQAVLQRTYAEQNQLATMAQAEQAQSFQQHLAAQQQDLLAKLPAWKDESKAKAEKTALREYLIEQGFDANSVENITDAKAVVMARKAMLYDQMLSKASVAAKKVSQLPTRVERSGNGDNPGMDRRSAAFQKLSKSGRVEDAANLFAGLI